MACVFKKQLSVTEIEEKVDSWGDNERLKTVQLTFYCGETEDRY